MPDIFQYGFMIRAFIAGGAIAIIAPLIGSFLVVKRYSLMADSLSHIALAGVAIGLLIGIYPIITAIIACVIAAIVIDKLREEKKLYEDAVLSLFLSGSLATALVLISLAHGFNVNIFNYLFGSITAVTDIDIYIILSLAAIIIVLLKGYYQDLLYIAFDEEAAKVSGLPVKKLNLLLMILTALTVALSMRIVGVLLIGALMVIPVLSALQISRSFKNTLFFSTIISLIAVFSGLLLSYYFNIIAGGAIVLLSILIFILSLFFGNLRKAQ